MSASTSTEAYLPREIAQAAGVPVEQVAAALGCGPHDRVYVTHAEAVRIGRALVGSDIGRDEQPFGQASPLDPKTLFSIVQMGQTSHRSKGLPLAVSGTLHAGVIAAVVLITTFGLAPTATTLVTDSRAEDLHMVFVATPGPGGGGGGGGLRQPAPPPKALREGRHTLSSPLPVRRPPPPVEPVVAPPEPPPQPLKSEPLPTIVAPIIAVPADDRDRIGVLQQAKTEVDSRGPGQGGGVGTGKGTGIGEGDGSGVGEGSGGGTGGGPYRPGSGIEPPRLLREVKAEYTDEARRRGLKGEVVLELVVRRDGTVSDVKVLRRLGAGLDDRAIQAVRQWRFAPATRRGTPVDVIVEVAVEFNLR
jgi:periplasmic protein TonB